VEGYSKLGKVFGGGGYLRVSVVCTTEAHKEKKSGSWWSLLMGGIWWASSAGGLFGDEVFVCGGPGRGTKIRTFLRTGRGYPKGVLD